MSPNHHKHLDTETSSNTKPDIKECLSEKVVSINQFLADHPERLRKHNTISEFFTSPIRETREFSRDSYLQNSDLHPNSFLILPFLNFYYWALILPQRIEFDKSTGSFFLKRRNVFMRICGWSWLVFFGVYTSFIFLHDLENINAFTVSYIIGKFTWASYTFFDFAAIKCLKTNNGKLAKFLTEGNNLFNLTDQILYGCSKSCIKKQNKTRYLSWSVCASGIIFTFLFIIFVLSKLTAGNADLYGLFLNLTSSGYNETEDGYTEPYDLCASSDDVLCNLVERFTTSFYASAMLTLWFFTAFSVESIWVIYLLMTAFGGLYFKKIFSNCIKSIETGKVNVPEGIRIYAKISTLLEDYNQTFGYTLLWVIVASLLYMSATLGEFLNVNGIRNALIFNIINVMGFIPSILTIYFASELHRTAQTLPFVIKKKFVCTKLRDCGNEFEVVQGTNIVLYDILSNNVGLKGAGFFTISYNFFGSLIGLTITYSLISVQLRIGTIIFGKNDIA